MEIDRKSVGLSTDCQAIIAEIDRLGWFPDLQDAARFCMSYAIRNGVQDGTTVETQTRWASGNFDSTGEIRAVLSVLYPECKAPVRLMEHLVNEGVKMVGQRIRSGSVGPHDLMK